VLRSFTTFVASRLAAALLIGVLSGAGGLAAPAAGEHRCRCQTVEVDGHHVCTCPICRLNGVRAAVRDASRTPEEHVAAMKALGDELARAEGAGPACSSQCDPSSRPGLARAASELFTLPQLPTLPLRETVESPRVAPLAPDGRDCLPELPPPRTART
jgi:hypothetical protein